MRGLQTAEGCKPAPTIGVHLLDREVTGWFLGRHGAGEVMTKIYDPGSSHASEMAELEAARRRLRDDRQAGLYDTPADADWYRSEYQRIGHDITALKALPERKPGIREVPAGKTIGQEWEAADNARRREMLAEFEVRAVVYPRRHDPRVVITGTEILPAVSAGAG